MGPLPVYKLEAKDKRVLCGDSFPPSSGVRSAITNPTFSCGSGPHHFGRRRNSTWPKHDRLKWTHGCFLQVAEAKGTSTDCPGSSVVWRLPCDRWAMKTPRFRGWNATQLYRDYSKPLQGSLLTHQDFMECHKVLFWSLRWKWLGNSMEYPFLKLRVRPWKIGLKRAPKGIRIVSLCQQFSGENSLLVSRRVVMTVIS